MPSGIGLSKGVGPQFRPATEIVEPGGAVFMLWLPSVTNILGVISKPELVEWKMTQAVLAALTLPRLNGEGEDAFAKRVVEDSQSRVRSAADFGSAFHAGAEQVAKSLEVDPAGPYAAWLNLYRSWLQANCVRVVWTERVLVNLELGYTRRRFTDSFTDSGRFLPPNSLVSNK
jgi:hypothetical protein